MVANVFDELKWRGLVYDYIDGEQDLLLRQPVTVYNGFDAYEYAVTGDYDAIVLDVMMPKLSGVGVPERPRAQAEARYAKALEQALGGPEEVAAALDTMSGLEGAADEDISQADLELAARWAKACTAARQAGFRDLGEAECMYFDVRLS